MARGKVVDKTMVDLVLQMKARNEKLTTEQIGAVVQCDSTTAGRIIRCGSWEAFCAWKEEKARKEREKNRKAEPAEEKTEAEEQVPGQICMELDTTGAEQKYTTVQVQIPADEPLVLVNEMKMMRFLAGKFDVIEKNQALGVEMINMKLDKLNDTLSMILRAVRKE